ncbi:hypothetical protein [Oceanobacillus indicireducens]|uniref:Uncharacterized protein n=1 Tax=Oceanobacillus indicireducens TaxID=1004261 RepID=A0A917XZK8_9BACI|nr:hypothetical protein [Oceanobacillus indicireducens]GGN59269.1 hypothetical protein GCM10007971_22210 [Oceanobacillus indicireducens]
MSKLTFQDHVKELKKKLNLDDEVIVIPVNDEKERLVKYEQFYKEKCDISLTELLIKSKIINGVFLWHLDKVVLVRNEQLIGTLAHEMRHAWQYKNSEKKRFKIKLNITPTNEKLLKRLLRWMHYNFFSRVEFNANKYAFRYCIRHGFVKEALYYLMKSILSCSTLVYDFHLFLLGRLKDVKNNNT